MKGQVWPSPKGLFIVGFRLCSCCQVAPDAFRDTSVLVGTTVYFVTMLDVELFFLFTSFEGGDTFVAVGFKEGVDLLEEMTRNVGVEATGS